MSVAFFDLDRTLIDCNSGRLWVQHEWRAGRISVRDGLWAGGWLLRYHLGMGEGLEAVFRTAVRSLRGEEEAVIRQRTEAWFDDEVRHRLRPGAAKTLETHREAGDRLVVATSSSVYAGSCAARAYGLDEVISSRFEVDDRGCFTGAVASMALGAHKADRMREWADRHGVDLMHCSFYTDSVTDLEALRCVGRPIAVNPDRALLAVAREQGWPVVDWGRAAD